MLAVINKEKIVAMVNEFYNSTGLADFHQPFIIKRLSAFTNSCISVGGGSYEDDFLDKDYAYDYELAMVLDCYNTDTFCIMPAVTFITDVCMAFEWVANKHIYVTSKADCIKLYESFAAYLETTQGICESVHGFEYDDMELTLCFADLYDNPEYGYLDEIDGERLNVLFDKKHFESKKHIIRTLNGCFQV